MFSQTTPLLQDFPPTSQSGVSEWDEQLLGRRKAQAKTENSWSTALQSWTDNRTMKGEEQKNPFSVHRLQVFSWPLQQPRWEHVRRAKQNCCLCLKMSILDMGHSSRNWLHAVLCLHCLDTFSYLMEELLSRKKKAESQHGTTRAQDLG